MFFFPKTIKVKLLWLKKHSLQIIIVTMLCGGGKFSVSLWISLRYGPCSLRTSVYSSADRILVTTCVRGKAEDTMIRENTIIRGFFSCFKTF